MYLHVHVNSSIVKRIRRVIIIMMMMMMTIQCELKKVVIRG